VEAGGRRRGDMRNAGLARWTFCKLDTAFYLAVLRGERGCDERARGELLHGVFNVVWLPGVARLHGTQPCVAVLLSWVRVDGSLRLCVADALFVDLL